MLNDIFIHEQLGRAGRGARHDEAHAFAVAQLRRRNSPARRAARLLGRQLHAIAEGLLAYAADRPRRLSTPVPPIVELTPIPGPYSQN